MHRKRTGKRIELSQRDLEIFRLLDRYRYLRSTYLYAFVGGASETRFKERLGDLYHEGGFIERPSEQWQFANCRSMPVIYELGEAGARVLREHGSSACDGPLLRFDRPGPCRQFAHAVMVSEIMASIELEVRGNPNLRLIDWREILAKAPAATQGMAKPFGLPVTISYRFPRSGKIETAHVMVVPDALFGLEYENDRQKSFRFFALEADRGTMPIERRDLRQTSYLKKILTYREIAARQLYQTQLGLPNFLVLTVTTSERHRDSIMALVGDLSGGSKLFLFKTASSLGNFRAAPVPVPAILTEPWERSGFGPVQIDLGA